MPSFDVVSKVDEQEVRNAVDQAGREITTRFDFKDIDASYDWDGEKIVLKAPSDFQVQQLAEILRTKLGKRNVDVAALEYKPIEQKLHQATQEITVKQGIDKNNNLPVAIKIYPKHKMNDSLKKKAV